MSRAILEIAQEAAERDATAPAPATLFNTNNRIARILRQAAADTMRDYLRKTNWLGQSAHHSTWIFSLKPGVFAYPLPPDFLRVIPMTQQRNGWPLGLVGPSSPQAWSAWLYGQAAVTAAMGWRIQNDTILIEPTPSEPEVVMMEYISRYPVVANVAAGDYDFTTNPPQAIAPIVPREGYIQLSDAVLETLITGALWDAATWDTSTWETDALTTLKRQNPASTAAPVPMVRKEAFEADTDMPAFADDHLLSLGMTFRLRRALMLPYAEIAAEYESEMEVKAATDAGGPVAFRIGVDCDDYAEQIPLGGGKWIIGGFNT